MAPCLQPPSAMSETTTTDLANTRDEVAKNLKQLISEAEDLLEQTAADTYEDAEEAVQKGLESIDEQIREARLQLQSYANEAKAAVNQKPLQSLAIAAGVGLVVGWIMGKK